MPPVGIGDVTGLAGAVAGGVGGVQGDIPLFAGLAFAWGAGHEGCGDADPAGVVAHPFDWEWVAGADENERDAEGVWVIGVGDVVSGHSGLLGGGAPLVTEFG